MFYPTESKAQGWRAMAKFEDGREALLLIGRSSTQVRQGYSSRSPTSSTRTSASRSSPSPGALARGPGRRRLGTAEYAQGPDHLCQRSPALGGLTTRHEKNQVSCTRV